MTYQGLRPGGREKEVRDLRFEITFDSAKSISSLYPLELSILQYSTIQ